MIIQYQCAHSRAQSKMIFLIHGPSAGRCSIYELLEYFQATLNNTDSNIVGFDLLVRGSIHDVRTTSHWSPAGQCHVDFHPEFAVHGAPSHVRPVLRTIINIPSTPGSCNRTRWGSKPIYYSSPFMVIHLRHRCSLVVCMVAMFHPDATYIPSLSFNCEKRYHTINSDPCHIKGQLKHQESVKKASLPWLVPLEPAAR